MFTCLKLCGENNKIMTQINSQLPEKTAFLIVGLFDRCELFFSPQNSIHSNKYTKNKFCKASLFFCLCVHGCEKVKRKSFICRLKIEKDGHNTVFVPHDIIRSESISRPNSKAVILSRRMPKSFQDYSTESSCDTDSYNYIQKCRFVIVLLTHKVRFLKRVSGKKKPDHKPQGSSNKPLCIYRTLDFLPYYFPHTSNGWMHIL